jgi:outer membrane protein OmpA-like peptidoglycan-associated protein
MTASVYTRRSDGANGGAIAQLSASVRYPLAALLLVVGIADLAVIDGVLLPRYLAGTARIGSPPPAQSPVTITPVAVRPAAVTPVAAVPAAIPQANPPVAEAPPPPAPDQPPLAQGVPTPAVSTRLAESEFPHVLFARNTSWLSPATREILGRLATTLAENPSRRVVLGGHTDNVGTEEFNRALSVERARRCGRWLEEHGVAPERMEIQGFGSTRPVGGDRSPEAQVHNRRVEIDLR